uniref:Uncharacterized protein n=1 Tax=Heterorhabditis bacteriophora TaxID=37862 RepID=A0A1I7WX37_HETBA
MRQNFNLILIVFIYIIESLHTISSIHVVDHKQECTALHVNTHGLNLICCSLYQPLVDSCEYASFCREEYCKCYLIIGTDLNCNLKEVQKTFEWYDHQPNHNSLSCGNLNLPNKNHPYEIRIEHWNNFTTSVILGLCGVNVLRMVLLDYGRDIDLLDLSKCLPYVKSFEILLRSK